MDSEERKRLRNCLIEQGFKRVAYTSDAGDGVYSESWTKGDNYIVIQWGERILPMPDPAPHRRAWLDSLTQEEMNEIAPWEDATWD